MDSPQTGSGAVQQGDASQISAEQEQAYTCEVLDSEPQGIIVAFVEEQQGEPQRRGKSKEHQGHPRRGKSEEQQGHPRRCRKKARLGEEIRRESPRLLEPRRFGEGQVVEALRVEELGEEDVANR